VVSLLVLMLLFWWAGSLASKLLSESLVYQRLETEADSILAALEFPDLELDAPRFGQAQLNPAYEIPYSGKYFSIQLEHGEEILSRSGWDQGVQVAEVAPGELARTRTTGVAGEELLVWTGGFSKNGHLFSIAVAEDTTSIAERLRVFQVYFAVMSLLLLLALLIVQHLIVRWSVNKLDRVRRDVSELEHGKVVKLSEDVPQEILPLVQEFNRLLSLFDQRLKHSRNSVGNLAHSLKGPLNLLLRASNESEIQDSFDRDAQVQQNAEQIRLLIERELKRARLAGRSTAGKRFDLAMELPALTGLLKQVYSEKDVNIEYNVAPDVEMLFDRQDMLELIGNLLDNSVKWASTTVRISLSLDQGVRMVVEDDGPGASPEQLHRLTERGVRLDESVAGDGLGLSIVADILETYGGQIEFSSSDALGGFKAVVHLPEHSTQAESKHDRTQHGADAPTGVEEEEIAQVLSRNVRRFRSVR